MLPCAVVAKHRSTHAPESSAVYSVALAQPRVWIGFTIQSASGVGSTVVKLGGTYDDVLDASVDYDVTKDELTLRSSQAVWGFVDARSDHPAQSIHPSSVQLRPGTKPKWPVTNCAIRPSGGWLGLSLRSPDFRMAMRNVRMRHCTLADCENCGKKTDRSQEPATWRHRNYRMFKRTTSCPSI